MSTAPMTSFLTTLFRVAYSPNGKDKITAFLTWRSSRPRGSTTFQAREDNSRREWPRACAPGICPRSEEHTSELQSRRDLVCRLLLEKKKKKNNRINVI